MSISTRLAGVMEAVKRDGGYVFADIPSVTLPEPVVIALIEAAIALEALSKHVKPYNEPTMSDCVLRSPGEGLRRAAEAADKREADIATARAALAALDRSLGET